MNKTFNAVPETSATRRLSPATLILRQMPLPANAADLCTRLYKNDSIREAAGLDSEEYKHVMVRRVHILFVYANVRRYLVHSTALSWGNFE